MLRSMFSSVVGLRSMQTKMDVIGDNIANVNTPGFKASRVTFADSFSETLRSAASPRGESGGANAVQIGLGTTLASVDMVMSPGTLQLTGRSTDLAIQGNGFFIVSEGNERFFTRAGNFNRDVQGYFVSPGNGYRLQGWVADSNGDFGVKDTVNLQDIQIDNSETLLATATSQIKMGGSLNATAATGAVVSTSASSYDSLGRVHNVQVNFTKSATVNEWTWAITPTAPVTNGTVTTNTGTVSFNTDGSLKTVTGGSVAGANADNQAHLDLTFTDGSAADFDIDLDFTKMTQPAISDTADSDLRILDRNGNAMGSLDNFFTDQNGTVYGVFTNGQRRALAQVALANFSNPEGLLRAGANTYTVSANSGLEQIGEPGTGGRGSVVPSNVESSNVDMAAQFTDMILTQRAYQANSRIITSSDELLQDLVNIKR